MIKAFLQSEQESELPVVGRTLLGSKKKVLLVKEESSTRYKLLQELNKAGVEVELASNAAIAMNKIGEVLVDAILVDSSLSDMKGADLVKQIRKKPGFGDIPYFICSSNEADSWPGRGAHSGLTKFFFKAATPVEEIVADVVTRLGVPPKRHVAAKADNNAAPRARSFAVPDNMPDEIKNFEFVKQGPAQAKAENISREPKRRTTNNDTNADTQKKYWESKVEELSVENIKLQRQLLEAGQGEQFKVAADRAEAACQAQAERAARLEQELAAFQAQADRAGRLEQELVLVRQAYDQLSGKVDEEQRSASDLRRRNDALEQELSRSALEAMRYKTELENRAADQGSYQSELSAQLIAARAEAASAEAACQQQSERAARFESDLSGLREICAALENRNAEEQQAALQARQRSDDLARRLAAATQDAQRLKTELEEQIGKRDPIETQLRQELEEAKAAAEKAEAALARHTSVANSSRQKVTALRRGRDELNTRLLAEQRKANEAVRQSRLLEQKLAALKTQSDKYQAERASLAKEVDANKNAAQKAQAAQREEVSRAKDQLAALQRAQAELNSKLTAEQHAVTEARRQSAELDGQLRQKANEISALKAELKQQQAERAALAKDFEAAKAAGERNQAGYREEATRAKEEVKALRQAQEQFNGKLAAEQQSAAELRRHCKEFEDKLREKTAEASRFTAELEQHHRERASFREQLDAAKAAAENAQRAFARCNDELTAACRAQDELNSRLTAEQNAAAEARRHKQELENKLRETANEFNAFRAETEQHRSQRESLTKELESARAALEQAQAAQREQASRWNDELAGSRRACDELNAKLANEQNSAAEFERRNRESEEKIRQAANDLSAFKAELDQQRAQRESLLKELDAAKAAAEKAQAACAEQSTELSRANEQLAALRSTREELHAKVISDRQAAAETARQKHQLEDKLREALTELATIKGEVRERASLVKQLEVARALAKKAQSACRKEETRGNRFGKQVAILRKARTELGARLEKEQKAAAESKRRVKQLEVRLARSAETGSRKRVTHVSLGQPANLSEMDLRVRDCVGALARATADLEQERRRLEATALSSGASSIDAARVGRAFVNSFRSQMRMPTENLMQAVRQLLESPLEGEQKKLVESALESALVLQASVQEEPGPENQAAA